MEKKCIKYFHKITEYPGRERKNKDHWKPASHCIFNKNNIIEYLPTKAVPRGILTHFWRFYTNVVTISITWYLWDSSGYCASVLCVAQDRCWNKFIGGAKRCWVAQSTHYREVERGVWAAWRKQNSPDNKYYRGGQALEQVTCWISLEIFNVGLDKALDNLI